MSDVKALFPIGKTQWAKWGDEARTAYNMTREQGASHAEAFVQAQQVQDAHKHKSIFDVIGDVVETVADVAQAVTPVVAVAKTVVKATKKKAK